MTQEQNRKNRQNGRYGEYRLAKKVNGVVVGRSKAVVLPSGKAIQVDCQRPPDVVTDNFAYESKYFKVAPACIKKVMTQAVRNCPEGLTPVGAIADREERCTYVIMMLDDWIAWHVGDKKDD